MCWYLLWFFCSAPRCQHQSTAFDCELLSPFLSAALYYAKIDQAYILWKYFFFALNIFNVFCVLLCLSQYLSASTGPVVACSLYWHLEPHINNLFYHQVSCSLCLQPPIAATASYLHSQLMPSALSDYPTKEYIKYLKTAKPQTSLKFNMHINAPVILIQQQI